MVGSGGLVAMNQGTCMVSIARFFMEFTQRESCGKCVLCREGTKQLLALLDDVIEGRADAARSTCWRSLAARCRSGSLCGLGKTAPNPVLSTMRYFRKEYEEHVFEKRCRTGPLQGAAEAGDQRPSARAAACASNVPDRRHHRRKEAAAPYRSRTLHQVRRVRHSLQTASRRGDIASEQGYAADIDDRRKNGVIEGERNLLELVRKAKIDLPTFCYHSELSVYGACRLCLVQVEGRGIMGACSTPPEPG
jgi:hypothetical protein